MYGPSGDKGVRREGAREEWQPDYAGPTVCVSIQKTKRYFRGSRESLKILCSEGMQVYLQ